ncbi:MAG: helix-turn-helix domain-containing protein, partial [Chloroflexi bacterium]|nr:helix-turn-helix domain-containing protein [Chloroflexota bacterium]
AQAMPPQEKAQRAKAMRAGGASYSQIADALGVTRGTVVNYLRGYPYKDRMGRSV